MDIPRCHRLLTNFLTGPMGRCAVLGAAPRRALHRIAAEVDECYFPYTFAKD